MRIREKVFSYSISMNVRAANVGVKLGVTQSFDALAQIGARQHLEDVLLSPAISLSSATRQVLSLS